MRTLNLTDVAAMTGVLDLDGMTVNVIDARVITSAYRRQSRAQRRSSTAGRALITHGYNYLVSIRTDLFEDRVELFCGPGREGKAIADRVMSLIQ